MTLRNHKEIVLSVGVKEHTRMEWARIGPTNWNALLTNEIWPKHLLTQCQELIFLKELKHTKLLFL